MSDNVKIKRSPQERQRLLVELEDAFKAMKPSVDQSLRDSLRRRILDLRNEVATDRAEMEYRAGRSDQRSNASSTRAPAQARAPAYRG